MSEAEALLNSLMENIAHHEHPVTDSDSRFVIDPVTREITSAIRKHYIMQGDHNSQVYTFELPRYIDGHDMFMCNQVKVHFNNIAEDEQTENADVADTTPLELNEDESAVICTWSIERNATQLVGILSFGLEYQCVTGDGEVVYEFNTDIYSNVHVKASRDNSEKAISEYSNILEQWRARIFGAGDSVMANIDSIADEQITAIHQQGATQKDILESTGNTQRDAIVAKGAEVLDTIPEDYTATHRMAEESVRKKANAIELESEGDAIFVDDSADAYLLGLKLYGKTTQVTTTGAQLANLPDGEATSAGVVWTCINGAITAKGTTTGTSSTNSSIRCDITGLTGNFTVSGNGSKVEVYVSVTKNGTTSWYMNKTFTLDGTETSAIMYCQVYGEGVAVNETTYPMLNAGDTALPWEPYTGGKPSPNPEYPQELNSIVPTVSIFTSNLLDVHALDRRACSSLEISDDGYTIALTGGTVGPYVSARYTLDDAVVAGLRGQTVTFSVDSIESTQPEASPGVQISVFEGNNPVAYHTLTSEILDRTFTIPDTVTKMELGAYTNNVSVALDTDNEVVITGVSMHIGDRLWEPYKNSQTFATNNPLPGIPVTSGGNYTDTNGQQWICDEIDFERGVYVQRIEEYVANGTPAFIETSDQPGRFSWNCLPKYFATGREVCLCNYAKWRAWGISDYKGDYDYGGVSVTQLYYSPAVSMTADEVNAKFAEMIAKGNPPTVVAQITTPIEIPIDGTAMAAFKALHTNCPNTTILNDAGAWMSVKYNADTKTYVENPKVLKLVDSSTGVVYELKIVDGVIVANPV